MIKVYSVNRHYFHEINSLKRHHDSFLYHSHVDPSPPVKPQQLLPQEHGYLYLHCLHHLSGWCQVSLIQSSH